MSAYGKLSSDVVVDTLLADRAYIQSLPDAADWVVMPYGVGIGWTFSGGVWTGPSGESPPAPKVKYRYLLTGPEWVQTFTDDEWEWIKTQRNTDPSTAATRALDKMMDAIRWTNSVDVSHENMDPFYDWLLNNGIPGGQTRIDELRQGVPI